MIYPILVGPMILPSFISLLFICKILLHYLFLLWYNNKLLTVPYCSCTHHILLYLSPGTQSYLFGIHTEHSTVP